MEQKTLKFCTKCKDYLKIESFYKDSSTKDGFHTHCKLHKRRSADPKIKAEYDSQYREKNVVRKKANNFKTSENEIINLFKVHNNLCVICKNPETVLNNKTKKPQTLAIDHCHKTGKIRGLLCANCNRALGLFKDNPILLQNAVSYLTKQL